MIRPAIAGDCQELTTLSFASKGYWQYPQAYFAVWKDELTISPHYLETHDVFVCEENSKIIGYYSIVAIEKDIELSGVVIEKGFWLEHMFVDPTHIGRGVGTMLFQHMQERCLSRAIGEVGILADPHARGFYEKMGCRYLREYPSSIPGRTTPYLRCSLAGEATGVSGGQQKV